jgi:vacuolar-type H+-ATPase subunit I/STV1
MNATCSIPISVGELIDRITILKIKSERISDENKLTMVEKELKLLLEILNNLDFEKQIKSQMNELKEVNETLWEVEDKIREKEKYGEFDEEFISLARTVYKTNDRRNIVKNSINAILNSEFFEIKSYVTVKK